MIKRIVNNRNLREKTYINIKNFVLHDVMPGEKINEDNLARKLGVSKTPVREALSKLAHDGIVKIIPNRGSYKVKLSKKDILEIMVIREALEGLCIQLAIENMNDKVIEKLRAILDEFETKYFREDFTHYLETVLKFYAVIYEAARNPRLVTIIRSMFDLTRMFRILYFQDSERVRHSLEIHREFINVLEKRDIEKAKQIRTNMIRSAYEYLIEAASIDQISYPLEKKIITPRGY